MRQSMETLTVRTRRTGLVEITPDAVRVRKKILETNRRPRRDGPKG